MGQGAMSQLLIEMAQEMKAAGASGGSSQSIGGQGRIIGIQELVGTVFRLAIPDS